ncbi:RHS repeat-associated core domain-containing protein [Flavobacterium branchiophilum]|uniref:RHS repeat-associated core domain-containing protein n=1 Tax=Flavobacterium branchiophilum TaxID=55197 RepID=UPI0005C78CA7|nr:RHS repeat-associated core domain-containing protein [Flavobacterium branchiophilum]
MGEVSQHSEYFAFGESFVEEHKNSHNSPYKFNGKELDEESGLYYYGARYYDARISFWASVDPLMYDGTFWAGKHNGGLYNMFNHGSYIYCYQNPVNLIDPNGKQTDANEINGGTLNEVSVVAGKKSSFSWGAFGRGVIKGLKAVVVVAAIVTVAVIAGPAILAFAGVTVGAGTVATITSAASIAGTVLLSGAVVKSGVELYTKKNIITGETLTTEQVSESAGETLTYVASAGAASVATKLIPASVAAPEVAIVETEVSAAMKTDIALGLAGSAWGDLNAFSKMYSAPNATQWRNLGITSGEANNFVDEFFEATSAVLKSGGRIKFNLDNVEPALVNAQKGMDFYEKGAGATN